MQAQEEGKYHASAAGSRLHHFLRHQAGRAERPGRPHRGPDRGRREKEQHDNNYTIVLNGHTDTVGGAEYNFKLSLKRAEAVKAALIKRGVPADVIRTFGFGKTDPAIATGDNVAEPKNRRVEIFLGDDTG